MQSRNAWVDYAKAIGITLVVYGHVARGLYNAGIDTPQPFYQLADSIIYTFHMPLFFFLSGLFFYTSVTKRGRVSLIESKIDLIVYPYIVWSIIQGVIEAALSEHTNGSVTYSEVFSLLWEPRAHFWFLYALFLIFCLAAVLFSVLSKRAAVVVLIVSGIAYVYSSALPGILALHFIAKNFVFFMFGVVFSLHLSIDRLSSRPMLILLAVTFAAAQFVFHYVLGFNYSDRGILSLLIALVSILFVISASAVLAGNRPSEFVMLIGSSSMAIYLIHVLTGSGIRIILSSFMGIESFYVHLVLGCLFALLTPVLVLIVSKKLGTPYLFAAPISTILMLPFRIGGANRSAKTKQD